MRCFVLNESSLTVQIKFHLITMEIVQTITLKCHVNANTVPATNNFPNIRAYSRIIPHYKNIREYSRIQIRESKCAIIFFFANAYWLVLSLWISAICGEYAASACVNTFRIFAHFLAFQIFAHFLAFRIFAHFRALSRITKIFGK